MIRKILPEEIDWLYPHIARDFPKNEHPPKMILKKQLRSGSLSGFVCQRDGQDLGYAFLTRWIQGFSLVFLYAVFPSCRGQGEGTRFMEELISAGKGQEGLILEVERPEDAKTQQEAETRRRRIAFYERLGYRLVLEIEYVIYGVPMYLMVRPLKGQSFPPKQLEKAIISLYDDLTGPLLRKKMLFSQVKSPFESFT